MSSPNRLKIVLAAFSIVVSRAVELSWQLGAPPSDLGVHLKALASTVRRRYTVILYRLRSDRMISIGIRASPTKITFVVYDKEEDAVINVESLRIPVAFDTPDALKYVRSNLLDILREYEVVYAGVRVTEPNAQHMNIARIQLEGVIQEAFASSTVKSYYVGQISSISARIGIPRTDFKLYIDGTKTWAVDGWDALDADAREAMLCALGASE